MSGSANKLYRKPSTSAILSGPPRFRSSTPSFMSFDAVDGDFHNDCGDSDAMVNM